MLWLVRRQLKSLNVETRRQAAEQLSHSRNSKAFEALKEALNDSDLLVRQFAATGLGKLDDKRIVDPLLNALQDSDAEVIKAALSSLRHSSDPKIITPTTPLLRHADAGVRGVAVQTLDRLSWRPNRKEDEIWQHIARGHFSRAASFGDTAITPLESVLTSGPSGIRARAIKALVQIDSPRALGIVLRSLKSNDNAACIAALSALATTGREDVAQPIAALLRNSDSCVRVAAIEALYTMRAISTCEQIRNLLRDSVWEVRRQAAEMLGRLKDKDSTEALTQTLVDTDADVRETAAMALGQVNDRRAIGPLVLALKDKNSSVRRIAAASLSRIDDDWSSSPEAEASFDQLKRGLDKEDSEVRFFVVELLMDSGVMQPQAGSIEHTRPQIAPNPEMRVKLAVTHLISMLTDLDPDFRQAAAHALGSLRGDRTPQPALMRALSDPDPGVRFAVEKALQQFGSPGDN